MARTEYVPSGAAASMGTSAEKVPYSVSGMLRDQTSLPRESVTVTSAGVPFAGEVTTPRRRKRSIPLMKTVSPGR